MGHSFVFVIAGVLLCVAFTGVVEGADLSGTKPGPHYVIMTRAERAAMVERVKNEPWAKELFERDILPLADRLLDREKEQKQWQPGQRGGEEQGYVVYAAVAYLVTGETRYLDAAWRRIKYQMDWTGANPKEKLSFYWGVDYTSTDVGVVYDLLAESFTPEQEQEIRAFIKQMLDVGKEWHLRTWTNPNMKFHELGALGVWAYAIGYEEHIDWILDHESPGQGCACGIKQLMRDYILDGHLDDEGPYYSILEAGSLSALAEASVRYGYKNFYELEFPGGGSLKHIMDGWLALAWPQWQDGMINVAPSTSAGVVLAGSGPKGGVWEARWPTGLLHRAFTTRVRRIADPTYLWLYSFEKEMNRRVFVPQHRAWALVRRFDTSLDRIMYGNIELPDNLAPPQAPSSLFPEAGVVMLRSPESADYWTRGTGVYMHGGEKWRQSMGGLPMIMLHAAGTLFYHDRYDYSDACTTGWKQRRHSKNTITIDGKDGICSYSVFRHSFDPEVKFASVRCWPYLEAEMERALMLTDEYLVEVFRAVVDPTDIKPERFWDYGGSVYWPHNASLSADKEGNRVAYPWPWKWKRSGIGEIVHHPGKPVPTGPRNMPESHTLDYTLRSLGELYPDNWTSYETTDEYRLGHWPCRWVENERRLQTDGSFYVDWVQTATEGKPHEGANIKTGEAGLRLRMLGDRETRVYLFDEPDERKGLCVRRTGKEALYVALHEPYRQRPLVQDFDYLHRPAEGENPPCVAVKVTGPGYVDRLYFTLELDGLRVPPKKEDQDATMKGRHVEADLTKGWLFKTDPDQVGTEQGWQKPDASREGWMQVDAGSDWKRYVPGYYGTAWYARTFVFPETLKGQAPGIHFAGADADSEVYLNGTLIGTNPVARWHMPFVAELGEAARFGEENTLVVRMHKEVYQCGLYKEAHLVAAGERKPDQAQHEAVAGAAKERKPDPLVTLTDEDDPSQGVAYRGQAFLRQHGDRLTARGDIEAFSIHAPGVKSLVLNGKEAACSLDSGYVVYGENLWKQASVKPTAPQEGKQAEWVPPIRASLPQTYVNLDADEGGTLTVKVEHVGFNVPKEPAACRLEIECPDLTLAPASAQVPKLAPGEQAVREFGLSGGVSGKVYAVAIRLYVPEGGEERLAQEITTDVAVGVVVREIEQQYDAPMIIDYFLRGDYPNHGVLSDQLENFDRLQVRAPGYTIEVDRFSGTSRYIVDPEGNVRTTMGYYPYRFTRGHGDVAGGEMADIRKGRVWKSYEIPTVWAPDVKGETFNLAKQKKVFGFWVEAEFAGVGTDDETGYPNATWKTKDGLYEMRYIFHPEAVEVNITKVDEAPAFRVDLSKLDVKDESYAYEAFVEGNRFGFRRRETSAK